MVEIPLEWRQRVEERLDKHDTDLYFGAGKENPSLTVRMDRVERFCEAATSRMNAVILLLVGAIITGWVDVWFRAHR